MQHFTDKKIIRDFGKWPLNGGWPLNRWPLNRGPTVIIVIIIITINICMAQISMCI